MAELISSNRTFTRSQQETIARLAELMIPEGDGMPSAADPTILAATIQTMNRQAEAVIAGIGDLQELAQETHNTYFNELQAADQLALIERLRSINPVFLQILQASVLACYYRDDRVLQALGLPARPPFPEGNAVPVTNWSLLDGVRRRTPFFRDV